MVILRGPRWDSVVQVISMPRWGGVVGLGLEVLPPVVLRSGPGRELEWRSGVMQPIRAVRPAWWLTLNSRPYSLGQEEGGDQYGRLCGAGQRDITTSDHGILAVWWMKRYFRRVEARDMSLSFGW